MDILEKHEKLSINQAKTDLNCNEMIFSDINEKHRDLSQLTTERETGAKASLAVAASTKHNTNYFGKDNQVQVDGYSPIPGRNANMQRETANESKGRHQGPCYNVSVVKTSPCKNDTHVFRIKQVEDEYKKGDEIHLQLKKYCRDNEVPCCAWKDNVNANLVDKTGRDIEFDKRTTSDGGWLFSCKASCEGSFTAIMKVNARPVSAIVLSVA